MSNAIKGATFLQLINVVILILAIIEHILKSQQMNTHIVDQKGFLIERLRSLKSQIDATIQKSAQIQRNIENRFGISISQPKFNLLTNASHEKEIQIIRQNIVEFSEQKMSPFNVLTQCVEVTQKSTSKSYLKIQDMVNFQEQKLLINKESCWHSSQIRNRNIINYSHKSLLDCFNASYHDYFIIQVGSHQTQKQSNLRLSSLIFQENSFEIFLSHFDLKTLNILFLNQNHEQKISYFKTDWNGNYSFQDIEAQIKDSKNKNILIFIQTTYYFRNKEIDLKKLNDLIKNIRETNDLNLFLCVDYSEYSGRKQLDLTVLNEIDLVYVNPINNLGGKNATPFYIIKKKNFKQQVNQKKVGLSSSPLGIYRVALSFQLLKKQIGYEFIQEKERQNYEIFIKIIEENRHQNQKYQDLVSIYPYEKADQKRQRGDIINFNIITDQLLIEPNFVCLLLSDIFGIASSPKNNVQDTNYQMDYFFRENRVSYLSYRALSILQKQKPGYLEIKIPFYFHDFQVQFIAKALLLVAHFSTKMDKFYSIDNDGEVKRKNEINKAQDQNFGLSNWKTTKQLLKKNQLLEKIRLKSRRETLSKQLDMGRKILQRNLNKT